VVPELGIEVVVRRRRRRITFHVGRSTELRRRLRFLHAAVFRVEFVVFVYLDEFVILPFVVVVVVTRTIVELL